MTYNVRNAKGLDDQRDIQRIANVILAAAPDVVAIQEVDKMSPRNYCDLLGELGSRTRMHARFAWSLYLGIGRYGLGVLSREQPLRTKRVRLPGQEEKRVMLIVEFKDYIFCCTHLSLTEADRMRSLDIIRSYAEKADKPFFLAGDFNAAPDSEFIARLSDDYTILNDVSEHTFPATAPSRTIDYIVSWKQTEGLASVTESHVPEEPIASDHRPVVVTLRKAVSSDAILSSGPFLQHLVDGTVAVTWVANVSASSWVEYAVDDALGMQEVTACPIYRDETVHRADIVGLASGDTLRYRICSQETLGNGKMGHTAKSTIQTYIVP